MTHFLQHHSYHHNMCLNIISVTSGVDIDCLSIDWVRHIQKRLRAYHAFVYICLQILQVTDGAQSLPAFTSLRNLLHDAISASLVKLSCLHWELLETKGNLKKESLSRVCLKLTYHSHHQCNGFQAYQIEALLKDNYNQLWLPVSTKQCKRSFWKPWLCKATSKMRAYQATQRLGRSYNTKTKEYND